MEEQLIELRNVTKEFQENYNRITAVKDVYLKIPSGMSISIVGPSGCGKSTLLKLIGSLLTPTSGEIYINGKNVTSLKEKERASLRNSFFGYVAQDYLLIKGHTVSENIEIPLLYAKPKWCKSKRKQELNRIIDKVGLRDKESTIIENLSGGQKQRVAIARALINNPKILLADEPTGALDQKTGKEIVDLLLELVAEGRTLIMVTHNIDISNQCQLQIKMLDGKIVTEFKDRR